MAPVPLPEEEERLKVDRAFQILYRIVLAWMERDPAFWTRIPEAFFEQGLIATFHVVPPGSPIAGDRDGKR
ncbi:MAG: hypothetical protein PVH02_13710 [Desulfobacteraceae bacterium]